MSKRRIPPDNAIKSAEFECKALYIFIKKVNKKINEETKRQVAVLDELIAEYIDKYNVQRAKLSNLKHKNITRTVTRSVSNSIGEMSRRASRSILSLSRRENSTTVTEKLEKLNEQHVTLEKRLALLNP